jgi:hypothetical protein
LAGAFVQQERRDILEVERVSSPDATGIMVHQNDVRDFRGSEQKEATSGSLARFVS